VGIVTEFSISGYFTGVFTTTVDAQQQKVTVTGSVGVETLIRKLAKAKKHAEVWPENVAAGKGNNPGKDKQQQQKKKKKNQQGEEPESKNNQSATANAELTTSTTTANSSKKKVNEKSVEKGNAESKSGGGGGGGGEKHSAEAEKKAGQSEGGGKKKKKKEKEMEKWESSGSAACNGGGAHSGSPVQVNLSPTRQQSYMYPESYCYPPLVYLATHNNRLCPMGTMGGPSYYVSPLPYMCAGIDHDPYRLQSTPFVPFEIFSDENANACSIM